MRKGNSDRKLQRHHVNIGSTCRKLRRKAAASSSLSSISFVYLSPPRPRTHLSRDTSLPFSLLLACSASPLWMTSSANCKTTSRSPMSSCWWRDRLICRPTGSSSPPPRPSAMWCRPPRSYVQAAVPLPPRASSLTSSPPRLPPTHTVPATRAPAAQEPWPRADLPPGAQASRRRHQCRTHRAPPPPTRDRHALSSLTPPLVRQIKRSLSTLKDPSASAGAPGDDLDVRCYLAAAPAAISCDSLATLAP